MHFTGTRAHSYFLNEVPSKSTDTKSLKLSPRDLKTVWLGLFAFCEVKNFIILRFGIKRNNYDHLNTWFVFSTDDMIPDPCATFVYAVCGRNFTIELRKHPGYNPAELCAVFIHEGGCIYREAQKYCDSKILKRFKENSDAAAAVVLSAICPHSTSHDMREELTDEKRLDKLFRLNRNTSWIWKNLLKVQGITQ